MCVCGRIAWKKNAFRELYRWLNEPVFLAHVIDIPSISDSINGSTSSKDVKLYPFKGKRDAQLVNDMNALHCDELHLAYP
jgi:hypothetical protein